MRLKFLSGLWPVVLCGVLFTSGSTVIYADVQITNNIDNYSKPNLEPDYQKTNQDNRQDIAVQFLGINDLHGGLETTGSVDIGSKTYEDAGTVGRLASYLNQAESHFKKVTKSSNSLRIEAGDMVGAAPANSSLLAHESTMHVLRAMKFKIGTLGNHEFDQGLPAFNRILTGGKPSSSADSLVKKYTHYSSGINIVVANVINKKDHKIPYGYKPYMIKTVKQNNKTAKIGIIGLETSTLSSLTLYKNYKDYQILDEAKTIAKYDKILRKKGVNAVVVVGHTGVQSKDNTTSGPTVDILKKLNDIDPDNNVGLYIAAHSHQYANAQVGHTHVVQAVYTGKAYDDSWSYISSKTGKFTKVSTHVYPVLSHKDDVTTKADKKVVSIVKNADKLVKGKVNNVIGYAGEAETITGRLHNSATMENEAGELVADAQLYGAQKANLKPNFAFTNTGGVRSDLAVKSNKAITWGSALAVQPFGNILQVVEMSGSQIRQALNEQYDENQQYYLQIAGLTYTYEKNDDENQPYTVKNMWDSKGQLVSDNQTYRVVINDFLHGAGDNFFAFKNTKIIGAVGTDTDVFIKYIKAMTKTDHKVVAPILNRKKLVE
ncbi:bifunctional metallophosphatase/5'-nucleotidase [Leuconostoc litchii]|uniref:Bifunctional metallophosphatase/5'-nucleotidase n=1 Tax=Leuconostoc litchii TaxID=1981069 RepID=A0A6P2CMW6_9LACO|nr:bifunctional metallophosphatase/5'-nucleotidase [Leuconostoc litchii]TYC46295.1 bifunctional metallophosphatase/5'-nucleotidase [Leuconostoc litchii]